MLTATIDTTRKSVTQPANAARLAAPRVSITAYKSTNAKSMVVYLSANSAASKLVLTAIVQST